MGSWVELPLSGASCGFGAIGQPVLSPGVPLEFASQTTERCESCHPTHWVELLIRQAQCILRALESRSTALRPCLHRSRPEESLRSRQIRVMHGHRRDLLLPGRHSRNLAMRPCEGSDRTEPGKYTKIRIE